MARPRERLMGKQTDESIGTEMQYFVAGVRGESSGFAGQRANHHHQREKDRQNDEGHPPQSHQTLP
jgi:hypothetical protein